VNASLQGYVGQVKDTTHTYLCSQAAGTINGVGMCLTSHKLIGDLPNILGDLLGSLTKGEKPNPPDFLDRYDGCNRQN